MGERGDRGNVACRSVAAFALQRVATSGLEDLGAAVDDVATDAARRVRRFVAKQVTARRG